MDTNQIREFFLSSREELKKADYDLTASASNFELAEQVESDLVDDYVFGRLDASERDAFLRNYLVTEARREKVALARGLRTVSAEDYGNPRAIPGSARGFFPRFAIPLAVGASAAVISIVGAYFGFKSRDVIPPQAAVQEPSVQIEKAESTKEVPTVEAQPEKGTDKRDRKFTPATITLSPGLLRSGGKEIVLSKEETRVPFLMKLLTEPGARTFSNYSIRIETPEGSPVTTSSTIVKVAKAAVTVSVVGKFEPGTYIVYLVGVDAEGSEEAVAEYAFKVVVD